MQTYGYFTPLDWKTGATMSTSFLFCVLKKNSCICGSVHNNHTSTVLQWPGCLWLDLSKLHPSKFSPKDCKGKKDGQFVCLRIPVCIKGMVYRYCLADIYKLVFFVYYLSSKNTESYLVPFRDDVSCKVLIISFFAMCYYTASTDHW